MKNRTTEEYLEKVNAMDMPQLKSENKRLATELLKQSKLTIAKTGITADFHQDLLNEVSFYKEQARNMGKILRIFVFRYVGLSVVGFCGL